MTDSARRPHKALASRLGKLLPGGDGLWELDLVNGTAWFSDWFYLRLGWPMEVKRKRLDDLRPNLPVGAWEALLLAIRGHLERQMPLDAELCVQLQGGQIEWWRMLGAVERNSRGKPVHLAGSVRDVTAEPRRDAAEGGT